MIELSALQQKELAREQRRLNSKNILKTGIDYWDAATLGIWPKDLVVLTARSGAGKTQISSLIAQNIANSNRSVMFFALEAYQSEIFNRMLFTELAKIVQNQFNRFINFRDFCQNKYSSEFMQATREAENIVTKKMENIRCYYRSSETKISELVEIVEQNYSIENQKNSIDLIIIDHLHYFDFDDDREYRAIKKAIRTLRTLSLVQGVPILLIAHIRKTDRKFQELVPDMEEIGGASEIFKEATQVISMAPYGELSTKTKFATLIKICKNRIDGSVNRYLGLMKFNIQTNTYDDGFVLYKNGSKLEEALEGEDLPHWAEPKEQKKEVKNYVNYTDL